MSGAVPGWYGKLPTLGDFASRRLDAQWVSVWDDWLAGGIAALREANEAWLDAYLASPPWRFVLMPGALPGSIGGRACAGVLVASVDRVGRYFPLTLVAPLDALPRSTAQLDALLGWLQQLEDIAVDAMQDDWPIDRLEQELAARPCPVDGSGGAPAAAAPLPSLQDSSTSTVTTAPASQAALVQLLADAVIAQGQAAWSGVSFWLAASDQPPRLMIARTLPAQRQFAALFGGSESSPA
jgi:type VI secretion system protein ImpM